MAASNVPKGCVESAWFYTKLEELKELKKAKTSKTTLFIEDCFFDETKTWLQTNPEERKSLNLGKLTKHKITRNNWVLSNGGKIITSDNKCVVPKREIHGVLCEAHSAISLFYLFLYVLHLRTFYFGISQEVITLFVSLCKLHQQQKSVKTTPRRQ